MSVPAYILSGGKSSRFGSDKARAELGGRPLVVRVARALRPFADRVVVVAAQAGAYADLGLETIGDRVEERGPVGGLLTAIEHARGRCACDSRAFSPHARDNGWLLVAACDLIELREAWLLALFAAWQPETELVAFHGPCWEPFPGLYHQALMPSAQSLLDRGRASVQALCERVASTAVPLPGDWPAVLQVNTKAALSSLER